MGCPPRAIRSGNRLDLVCVFEWRAAYRQRSDVGGQSYVVGAVASDPLRDGSESVQVQSRSERGHASAGLSQRGLDPRQTRRRTSRYDSLCPAGPAARLCGLCATLGLLAALHGVAQAKNVIVLPFGGPRGKAASNAVQKTLGSHRVLPAGPFRRVARQRRQAGVGARAALVAASAQFNVAATLQGQVKRRRGRWVLAVTVYSGHSGRPVGSRSFRLRGTRVDRLTLRLVKRTLVRYIRRCRPPGRGRSRARPPVAVAPDTRSPPDTAEAGSDATTSPSDTAADRQTSETPGSDTFDDGGDLDTMDGDVTEAPVVAPRRADRARRRVAQADDLGFQGSAGRLRRRDDGDDREAFDEDAERMGRQPWQSLVEVSAGLLLLNRRFAFSSPQEPREPPDYKTPTIVPAAQIEGAVFPLATITRTALANLGFAGRYYRVFGLKSSFGGGNASALDTVVQQFEAGVRFRWNVFDKPDGISLRLGVDYGQLAFHISDPANSVPLPDITYSYVKFAILGLNLPLYYVPTFTMSLKASFDYLLILSAGAIERTSSGGYGNSTTNGIEAGGGLNFQFSGFFADISGFYRRVFYSFDGLCYRQSLGCNFAGGALDIFLGLTVSFGYAY